MIWAVYMLVDFTSDNYFDSVVLVMVYDARPSLLGFIMEINKSGLHKIGNANLFRIFSIDSMKKT